MCCAYYLGQRLAEALSFRKAEIRPSDSAPVFRMGEHGREQAVMRFGFPTKDGSLLLNARCETILEKALFREHLFHRRILIPATGFHEWDPYRRRHTFCSLDGSSLYLAGIHDGEHFVIITTEANESLRAVHDRMPLILDRSLFAPWLQDRQSISAILRFRPALLEKSAAPEQMSLL